MKCCGDFCGFIEEEEALLRETEEDALQVEAKRAIGRHRKLESYEVDGADDGAAVLGSPVNRSQQSDLLAPQQKASHDMSVMLSSQAYKVPQKNIVLVRNDMLKLEETAGADGAAAGGINSHNNMNGSSDVDINTAGHVPWPALVQHWWWRVGRSVVENKSKRIIVPQSSGHEIHNSIMGVSSSNSSNSGSGGAEAANRPGRKLTAHNLGLVTGDINALTSSPSAAGTLAGAGTSEDTSTRFNALACKETNSKLGDLSWYYSDASVCERCYQVYREIDRRRQQQVRGTSFEVNARSYDKKKESLFQSLPIAAKESLQSVSLLERDRYLQQRQQAYYTRQKALSSRLAVAKRDDNNSINSSYNGMDAAGSSEYSEFGGADSLQYSSVNGSRKYTSPAGAPKGSIPPSPWNLHDESVRSAYADSIGSTFIRNIRSKAEKTVAMQAQHEHHRRRHTQQQQEEEEDALLGGSRAVDDSSFKWSAITGGATAPRDPSELSSMRRGIAGSGGGGGGLSGLHKSHSAGEMKRRKKPKEVIITKQFDSSRLLHPWMRDMESERASRRMEDEVWKNDQELMNRYQSLQNTTIARKLPRKPKPGVLRPLPLSAEQQQQADRDDAEDEAVLSRAIQSVGRMPPKPSHGQAAHMKLPSYPSSSSPSSSLSSALSSSSTALKKGSPSYSDQLSSSQPKVIPAMASSVRFSNDSELGLTRKNSLHTIEELDDEADTSPVKSKFKESVPSSRPVKSGTAIEESKASVVSAKEPQRPPLPGNRSSNSNGGGNNTIEQRMRQPVSASRLIDDGDDDDDDDDEGIGWSPFVVPKF